MDALLVDGDQISMAVGSAAYVCTAGTRPGHPGAWEASVRLAGEGPPQGPRRALRRLIQRGSGELLCCGMLVAPAAFNLYCNPAATAAARGRFNSRRLEHPGNYNLVPACSK